jgi:hypothetical protein
LVLRSNNILFYCGPFPRLQQWQNAGNVEISTEMQSVMRKIDFILLKRGNIPSLNKEKYFRRDRKGFQKEFKNII